jgi:hypothetical protein
MHRIVRELCAGAMSEIPVKEIEAHEDLRTRKYILYKEGGYGGISRAF